MLGHDWILEEEAPTAVFLWELIWQKVAREPCRRSPPASPFRMDSEGRYLAAKRDRLSRAWSRLSEAMPGHRPWPIREVVFNRVDWTTV